MRKILRFFIFLFVTLAVVGVHFFCAYTSPYPFDKINILFIYLLLYLLVTQSGSVVWVAFFTHMFIEVFPSNTFGVTLMSSSLALLFSYWFHMYYITNKKWYSATALMIFSLLCYRIFYSVLLFFVQRVRQQKFGIEWNELWQLGISEMLMTSVVFAVIYLLLFKFSRNFNRAITK